MGFPADEYTPNGYLDIPTHTRRLTPAGVMRSHDVGFRWHFPALATSYGGRRETYRAGLRIAVDGAVALADFDTVRSPYHSKNLLRYAAAHGDAVVDAEFHLVGADVLVARLTGRAATLAVRADYTRQLSADGGWGESGLVARRAGDCLLLQGFEDGEAFALWASAPAAGAGVTGDEETAAAWTMGGAPDGAVRPVTVLGERGESVTVSGVLTFSGTFPGTFPGIFSGTFSGTGHDLVVLLARGRSADQALAALADAREHHPVTRAALLAADERFWATAPRLTGDWPDHWRRGLVYDLETLRMMVKPPVGIYTRPWDAMQIQAPRVVLAEAAIDALLLGYADPGLAQRLLLGTFADALAPNVPCSREDGSVTMVSADGANCGTGPQWGYPFVVAGRLYRLHPDTAWLAEIYPYLAGFLDWWLAHRTDADGWLVHACSWESGQDLSPRFGDQPLGGGHPTWHIRAVDLQAAVAHAADTMAGFAAILGRDRDVPGWRRLAAGCRDRLDRLWNGSRYADVDARTGAFTGVDDVMLLAPVSLGVAGADHGEALRPALRSIDPAGVEWPMFAWTAVDAALNLGEDEVAAALAGSIVDRAYRFWDAPAQREGHTLPGIASEYWPASGRCGGEGYGWGAFTAHLLLGTLVGLRVTGDGVTLRPNLPAELCTAGRDYRVRLTLRGRPLEIGLRPDGADGDGDGVTVCLAGRTETLGRGAAARWTWQELYG